MPRPKSPTKIPYRKNKYTKGGFTVDRTPSVDPAEPPAPIEQAPIVDDRALKRTKPGRLTAPSAKPVVDNVQEARAEDEQNLYDLQDVLPGALPEDCQLLKIADNVIRQMMGKYTDVRNVVFTLNRNVRKGPYNPEYKHLHGCWFEDEESNSVAAAFLLVLSWIQRLRHRILTEGFSGNLQSKQELIQNLIEELLLGPSEQSQIIGKSFSRAKF